MLEVTWRNTSRVYSWTLFQHYTAPPPWGRMALSPSATLPAGEFATTSAQMTIAGQTLINAADMFFSWHADIVPAADPPLYWFATRLNQPVNVGTAGYSPYWQICAGVGTGVPLLADSAWDTSGGQNLFRTPVEDASIPYVFDAAADAVPANLKIAITPTAGGSDLSLFVEISDLA